MVASKKPRKETAGKNRVSLTSDSLVVKLTAENRKAMEQCLKKSGKIVLKFKQIEVTKLPGIGNMVTDPTVD